MSLLHISSLQNKLDSLGKVETKNESKLGGDSPRTAYNEEKSQNEEKRLIENLLQYMATCPPQQVNLDKAKKLIDFHVFAETKEYLEKALPFCQDSQRLGQIYFLAARCCYGLNDLAGAIDCLDQAISYEQGKSEYWNLKADCLLELGQWKDAITVLNKCIRSSPGDPETIFRLGSIFLFHGEYAEALNCFNGCCKLKPFNSEYWEMKAEMLIKLNQYAAASKCFQKAKRYGGDLHTSARLAYCYARMGHFHKAKRLLLKVLSVEPDNYDALYNLAGIYNKLNENDHAYRLLKKALSLNSNDPLLYNNLAYVCSKLGRYRKAVDYYRAALKINPYDKIILYNLACCLYDKGDWEDARITLEKLVSLDRNDEKVWTLLGNVYEQLSRFKKAVDCYNQSLGLA